MSDVVSRISMTDARVQVMGRTEPLDNGGLRFGYPGVTTRIAFTGNALWLQAHSSTNQSYLEVIVDGGEPQLINLTPHSQRISLLNNSGTASSSHQIDIIHRSETWQGTVTLEYLEISNGELLTPPPVSVRRLLVLGDSVTCGEAIDRTPEGKKDSRWWNPRLSYGMLLATALDAQVQLVCYGGRGLVRSWNGRTDELNLPDYADLAIADTAAPIPWDHERYVPDLILSAIGTNDFSQGIPDGETYIATYGKFVRHLLALYPYAQVVLTEGAILNDEKKRVLTEYLQKTQQQVDDPRLHIVPSHHYPGDSDDAHPTKTQHAAMATDLAPLLRAIMRW